MKERDLSSVHHRYAGPLSALASSLNLGLGRVRYPCHSGLFITCGLGSRPDHDNWLLVPSDLVCVAVVVVIMVVVKWLGWL